MKAWKGFNPDLTCRGFQYEEGKSYTHDSPAQLCRGGFHAVTMPLDVLSYYPPATSVFHEVELDDVTGPEEGGDSKIAGRTIRIGAKIELPALIQAQVEFVFANAKKPGKNGVSDEANGLARATKKNGAATASGDRGAATASGDSGAATASGYSGAATASGYRGAATASGISGAATASGISGAATASGYRGAATASGYRGAATASGYQSIAIVTGRDGRARGKVGSWIVITERDRDWNILGVQSVKVDGDQIKPDIFYTLRDGVIVEAE